MRGTARSRARRIMDGTGDSRFGLWGPLVALLILLPLLPLVMIGGAQTVGAAPTDSSNGAMHILLPVPQSDGKTVQGPVGANVSISGGQVTAGASYNLGWVPQASGCSGPITPFTDTPTFTADDGGNFTATFVWPAAAGTPGAVYLICASDSTNPTDVITADQVFQVLGASAPTITLSQAPSSTHSGDSYSAGGPVQVQGTGFLPQGTAVAFFVTSRASFAAQDYQPDNALKTEGGAQVVSDGQGQFTTIVTLPKDILGRLFFHAVSTDAIVSGQTGYPPSLSATSDIQITAPQATPTVQPSPTPKAQSVTPPAKKPVDHTKRIVAIATLGVLSIILFIIGGILIASSALGPRTPPKLDSGTRAQPTGVHADQGW